jgi:diguanylate cyclase (GGDEF)-like protein
MAISARSGKKWALLFIDLDHFKKINDTLGHGAGDLLLQQAAARLSDCVSEIDTVARMGGDEFVVLLEDLSANILEAAETTEHIAETILASLGLPYRIGVSEQRSTASIGITLLNGHDVNMETLLKQADIAMYQSKKMGRNTLHFFDPDMQQLLDERAMLEDELHKAIDEKQFQLHYQIQCNHLNQPLGAEALIRWIHPEKGMISPAKFIPLAEESNLILPLGKWVLETACAQLLAWQQNPATRKLRLSINVSAKQFRQASFVDEVKDALQRYAINPAALKLELTESMLLDNIENIIAKMEVLRTIGIRFSLDDFGTGYSSLQYLKRLPLSQLKIDQAFVRDLVNDSNDKAIVRTIIAMAESMELNIIAEGVETTEQRDLLLTMGCQQYQGYLLGRPMPIAEFEAALQTFITH